ncbi:AraC family transcriptional regulator [Caenimonas sp. SL110]|uniref:AraC family transcriptional regulator n=1 Tax=Caenimonas sp. SL110 TaxID=1450524 RepID=UPI00065414CA|nr:AraC family transcriptional regulator [Caenimonas sp. SL110]
MNKPRQPAAATPMALARCIVAAYQRAGRHPQDALKLAHIAPAQLKLPDARITSHQMEVLSGAAMKELDDEGLGAFRRPLPWGSYGMLARASLTSPDLGVALKRWCRHHSLIADDIRLNLVEASAGAAIVIEELKPPAPAPQREFSIVHVLRNIHGLACWYVDSRIPLQEASFPFAAPPHVDAYRHMFPGGPVNFNAAHAEIRFDAQYLALPLRRDEKALRLMLQRALPLTVLQYRRDRLLVEQVRQAMLSDPTTAHNAHGIAAHLNISIRTLHRQLAEQGSSLQALKDEVRCDRARDLLHRSARPIKQVAAAVGFSSEKSFIRAFRDWTGQTPSGYRSDYARP